MIRGVRQAESDRIGLIYAASWDWVSGAIEAPASMTDALRLLPLCEFPSAPEGCALSRGAFRDISGWRVRAVHSTESGFRVWERQWEWVTRGGKSGSIRPDPGEMADAVSGASAASGGAALSRVRGSMVGWEDGPEGETHGCAGWRVPDALGLPATEVEAAAFEEDGDLRL